MPPRSTRCMPSWSWPATSGPEFVERHKLFEVSTTAGDKAEYLHRPRGWTATERRCDFDDRGALSAGRRLASGDRRRVVGGGRRGAGAGLVAAVGSRRSARGWSFGQPFVIRHCRVGVLNDIGELLDRAGRGAVDRRAARFGDGGEPVGLSGVSSRTGHTDAKRNLISNIHARGVAPAAAAERILALAAQMRAAANQRRGGEGATAECGVGEHSPGAGKTFRYRIAPARPGLRRAVQLTMLRMGSPSRARRQDSLPLARISSMPSSQ